MGRVVRRDLMCLRENIWETWFFWVYLSHESLSTALKKGNEIWAKS